MAKKILLIDDEVAVSSVFETALKAAGYDVKIAVDGKSGLESAKTGGFDLILCDQMMPDMSGNDVLKTLKADAATKDTKIALLTNFNNDDMVKEALSAGAVDYILKFQTLPDDLVKKVEKIIGQAS